MVYSARNKGGSIPGRRDGDLGRAACCVGQIRVIANYRAIMYCATSLRSLWDNNAGQHTWKWVLLAYLAYLAASAYLAIDFASVHVYKCVTPSS